MFKLFSNDEVKLSLSGIVVSSVIGLGSGMFGAILKDYDDGFSNVKAISGAIGSSAVTSSTYNLFVGLGKLDYLVDISIATNVASLSYVASHILIKYLSLN